MIRPLSKHTFIYTVFSLMLLNGCAVGPDYQLPVTKQLPAAFVNAAPAEFAEREVETAWWQLFNDQQLSSLIDQTIQHNYELKAARANLSEARALYLETGLNLLPTVTSHGNYTEQKRSTGSFNNRTGVFPRELKLYNTGFDASWEVDFFGRVRRNVEASNDEVEAQEASLRDIGVSLIAETARNYFELRGLQNQLAVARKNADNQAQTLDMTQVKLENGRGTELDTSRALAQLESTKASIPPLESALTQAIHRLSVLTGQMPDALTGTLALAAPLPKAPDTIQIGNPEQLLRRRPDIRIAERGLAAATARIGVATADLFPRVTFVGSLSLEASTLSGIVAPGSESYSVGPKISWAAFDLGRVYARIKAADARAEASLAQYEQTVLNALEETENALVTYKQERARRASLTAAAQASEKASELAHLRYQEGVSDFLAVLDSELRLLQDQSQLAQSETATATALTAVYKALGGGWLDSATKTN
ncbi:Efflux transport system, outer membrane factor (OMF) lipoprotein [Methylomonas albis]|uniref:Efflux transporter outer membrane subunit n=1 Tax=Methylomonas albis TaxID=1854563 RepID=A0ABR9D043_9GAMM|nr:efflux transporter outer membrane subunit [Methylomonas albis]MBD9356495.1 efflux transporter outer membrane subunit [Methylomonas albis]CAD6879604.1 Efflux transport system, outer membrane factor (OMF) lipoprotein [Methylomonas albis]